MQLIRLQRLGFAALLVAGLTGCTTYIDVSSDPEGALITDPTGAVVYGYAPVSVPFDQDVLKANAIPGRCPEVPGFMAKWPSGATALTASPLPVCDLTHGLHIMLTRPKDAPGLDQDLTWALKRAQERARIAEAERDRMQLYLDNPWGPYWMRPWPSPAWVVMPY